MIILLDMDGVMADWNTPLLEQYNFLTNEGVTIDQIKSVKTYKWVKDPMTMKRLCEAPGFVRNLPPMDGAIEAVEELHKKGHDICFVSNATNCLSSAHEKREWLRFHFSKVWQIAPLVLTQQKFRVRGDVLLDDFSRNLENLHPETKGLLWHTTYNADIQGFERIYSWDHFMEWVAQNDK